MFRRISWCVLAAGAALYGADKPNIQIQELQRDVAGLQNDMKALQRSLEERMGSLASQVQGAAEAARGATAAMAGIQKAIDRVAHDQEQKLAPVATLATRMDQVSGGFGTMQQAMADLTSTISKLQSKIDDISMAVKVLQQPATPPPAAVGAASSGPQPPASELWISAEKDRSSGKLDLALQQYMDYVKWYPDTSSAASAQYYIGWIHYSQQDYEAAVKDYDALLAKYRDSSRAPEAYFYKGQALTRLGRTNDAAESFRELRTRFPNHSLARQTPGARGR